MMKTFFFNKCSTVVCKYCSLFSLIYLFFMMLYLSIDLIRVIFMRIACQAENCSFEKTFQGLSGRYFFIDSYWKSIFFNAFSGTIVAFTFGIVFGTMLISSSEKMRSLFSSVRLCNKLQRKQIINWYLMTFIKTLPLFAILMVLLDFILAMLEYSNCHTRIGYCDISLLFNSWSNEGKALSFFSKESYVFSILERWVFACLFIFFMSVIMLLLSVLDWYQLNKQNESTLTKKQLDLKFELNSTFGKKNEIKNKPP